MSPLTLIKFEAGFFPVVTIDSHFVRSVEIRVAADPVSGKVLNAICHCHDKL